MISRTDEKRSLRDILVEIIAFGIHRVPMSYGAQTKVHSHQLSSSRDDVAVEKSLTPFFHGDLGPSMRPNLPTYGRGTPNRIVDLALTVGCAGLSFL